MQSKGDSDTPKYTFLEFLIQKRLQFKDLLVDYPKPLKELDVKVVNIMCNIFAVLVLGVVLV